MYTPKHFNWDDTAQIQEFVKQYPLALTVAVTDRKPVMAHIPFILSNADDNWVLTSHFYKHNPLAEAIQDNPQVTVVFSIPGAYISPQWYHRPGQVPTWNYVAVHFEGQAQLIDDRESNEAILFQMIEAFNPEDLQGYRDLDEWVRDGMLPEILGLKITVTDIDAKAKLSQNKSEKDRQNIAQMLMDSGQRTGEDIAKWMLKAPK